MANLAVVDKPQDTAIERVLIDGDLAALNPEQRTNYYMRVCQSLGLNPLTKPFAYIKLNGRLVLYALKDATEQLRKLHSVSITELSSQRLEDVFVVTAKAQDKTGRTDAATGAVTIGNLKGESLANALMKAETKAKRRATLSICGLGMLDETEAEPLADPPTVVVEAPKAIARAPLPEGAVYILRTEAKAARGASWSEVTYVDGAGEEHTLPTPADGTAAAVSLFEQLAQDGVPVWLETTVTPRSKKTVIKAAHRQSPEDRALDAEVSSAPAGGAF